LFIIFDGDDAVVGVRRVYVSKVFVYLTIIGVRRIPLARMATMWPYDGDLLVEDNRWERMNYHLFKN